MGERERKGRKVYTYLLKDFLDTPSGDIEHLQTFENLVQLNLHLEKEFKAAF